MGAGLVAHATGEPGPARADVAWPGTAAATVAGLSDLHDRWSEVLARPGDLDRPFGYPWPQPRPFVVAAAWANMELMKNVAELGQLRDLHGALRPG